MKRLVLDANILIRGVLGIRVPSLLTSYVQQVDFFAPDVAFTEAGDNLPDILVRRGIDSAIPLGILYSLRRLVEAVASETYTGFEKAARRRLAHRDPNDWPILATALALRCPLRTEDNDFFGCGVATWTSDRVEIYMTEAESQ